MLSVENPAQEQKMRSIYSLRIHAGCGACDCSLGPEVACCRVSSLGRPSAVSKQLVAVFVYWRFVVEVPLCDQHAYVRIKQFAWVFER